MEDIDEFLSTEIDCNYGGGNCSGNGSGDGSGEGYGRQVNGLGYGLSIGGGYSCGNGYGDKDKHISCNGDGYGYGYRFDNSIKKINNLQVVSIDYIHTIIENIHGNYAKGYILRSDLTTIPCFIAKYGDYFAHGKTLAEAREDAQAKYEENLPFDELIDGKELFYSHNIIAGSRLFGR